MNIFVARVHVVITVRVQFVLYIWTIRNYNYKNVVHYTILSKIKNYIFNRREGFCP